MLAKILLSLVVIVGAVPGLVIEPGPISEIVAIGILGSIWGLDVGDAADAGGGST